MGMTDPIADLLTRVRNAFRAHHLDTYCPHSKIKEEIVKILKEEGYIEDYEITKVEGKSFIHVMLKYYKHKLNVISEIDRISKPGRRIYVKSSEIPSIRNGYGITVLSTPKGIMTNKRATEEKLGGELLLSVW